ncbi:MAG: phenylalanine--tRNA ligase subunit alpha, partial [Longimicrobiales bacterium]|nr:phenylalanine--tRNA ligase subunit alpha [Longimicrobiales bacterium]
VRVSYLGRSEGQISAILRGLGQLPAEERPAVGQRANQVKGAVSGALEARTAALSGPDTASGLDLTMPGRARWLGGLHPITQAVNEIWHFFRDLGFARARGPEADTEWYNFEALNTPLDHPAADEQDTLYLVDSVLLRSHTSPVQMRTMEANEPPIRIIAPGWVYRRDTYDATHTPAFMQIEGLVIDEDITFVDFKATLAEFARRYWGPDTQIRFRPSFFPFTEPSAEVDVKRVITRPDGTRYETDWLEIMGAGMVDPNVIANAGYDPERYTGWAFGMGPGRIAMLKHGVDDLRTFFENDVRFLGQFAS